MVHEYTEYIQYRGVLGDGKHLWIWASADKYNQKCGLNRQHSIIDWLFVVKVKFQS